ncbi:hypothetical protein DFS33DRAFT_1384054 [Desarmillaria ectypa]|nr:hypothetical protein DFS33DRAFT_1384054 [Desarmillaria ectypa]
MASKNICLPLLLGNSSRSDVSVGTPSLTAILSPLPTLRLAPKERSLVRDRSHRDVGSEGWEEEEEEWTSCRADRRDVFHSVSPFPVVAVPA